MADRASLRSQPEDRAPAHWNKFHIVLMQIKEEPTNRTHESVVELFKSLNQTKVTSPKEADYLLIFCPAVSQFGPDIKQTIDHLAGKEAVLVVMHHTSNPELVIPTSRRQVEDQRVKLTLDCLFDQNNLLEMNNHIKKFFGVQDDTEVYRRIRQMICCWGQREDRAPASCTRFFVVQTGTTNGVHQSVVKLFKSLNQTEVRSLEEADYLLVFCPVVSRVGPDVSDAMDSLLPGKDAVLVVMHHTFNPEQVIPPSRRLVEDQRVKLTLDCLFYKKKLLKCEFNNNMNSNIKKFFRVKGDTEASRALNPSGSQSPDDISIMLQHVGDTEDYGRTPQTIGSSEETRKDQDTSPV